MRVIAVAAALVLLAGCAPADAEPERTVARDRVDASVRAVLADVERYWARTFPELTGGTRFIPVSDRHSYTRAEPPPSCGPPEPARPGAAAYYCAPGDFIAWDAERLAPLLLRARPGAVLVAVEIAREYGHAVQARLHLTGPADVLERQADCFAGAWLGGSVAFGRAWPAGLDTSRAEAFREGFGLGAGHCAAYRVV